MPPFALALALAATAYDIDPAGSAHLDTLRLARFVADSPAATPPGANHFDAFRVDSAALARILVSWHAVSEDAWRHNYSHVGFGDRTGSAVLTTGESVRWLVRPGGLAFLQYQDGRTLYLAVCVSQIGDS